MNPTPHAAPALPDPLSAAGRKAEAARREDFRFVHRLDAVPRPRFPRGVRVVATPPDGVVVGKPVRVRMTEISGHILPCFEPEAGDGGV